MSKMIAVCGSPYSGKTTFALKLAQEIYWQNKGTGVLFLSPDLEVPSLGFIFPNSKDRELYSIGRALDKTDIYKEDVMRQFVNVKTMLNFAFLGFKLGENKYSYPQPTEDKVNQFFKVLRETADYIVVDCTCCEEDLISRMAKRDCDAAIQLLNPDIRSMIYNLSCVNQFLSINDKKIRVMNVMDNELYLPINDAKKLLGNIDYTIPYSRPIKQQAITGTLSEKLHDNAYRDITESIAKRITEKIPLKKEVNAVEGN